MDTTIRDIINSLTDDIIKIFKINIPIGDIEQLVKDLGGTIVIDNFCLNGELVKNGDGFKIILSPFQDEKRKRFTVAHELGHLFLHMGYLINEDLWNRQDNNVYYRLGSSEKEYQADEFAAALLMPKAEYYKIMEEYTTGNYVDTLKIAEYFNVSVDAASNRGKFLGYLRW